MFVAEKLGQTLSGFREQATPEELSLWLLFFELRSDEEKKALEQARRKRR
jgi:hypothetical protein